MSLHKQAMVLSSKVRHSILHGLFIVVIVFLGGVMATYIMLSKNNNKGECR